MAKMASFSADHSDDPTLPAFDIFARLSQEVDMSEFHSTALDLHQFLKTHYLKSDFNRSHNLPIYFQLRAYPDVTNSDEELTAMMDFSSVELSRDVCVGHLYNRRSMYKVLCFYRDGSIVNDQTQCAELERRFFVEWPGVPGHQYVRVSSTSEFSR